MKVLVCVTAVPVMADASKPGSGPKSERETGMMSKKQHLLQQGNGGEDTSKLEIVMSI